MRRQHESHLCLTKEGLERGGVHAPIRDHLDRLPDRATSRLIRVGMLADAKLADALVVLREVDQLEIVGERANEDAQIGGIRVVDHLFERDSGATVT